MMRQHRSHSSPALAGKASEIVEAIILVMIEKGLIEPDAVMAVLEDVLGENRELSSSRFLRACDRQMHAEICAAVEKLLLSANFYAARH